MTEKENLLLVLSGQKPMWIPSFFHAASMEEYITLGMKKIGDTDFWKNPFGVLFKDTPDGKIPLHTKDNPPVLKDISDWKQHMPEIDLDIIDWKSEAEEIKKKACPDKAICLLAGYIWEEMYWMMGFEEAFVALMTEPEECSEFLMALSDFWIDVLNRIYPYLKPEIVLLFNHLATHKGLLISHNLYKNVIKPADMKFIQAVRKLDTCAMVHIDGLIEELLPDFAEMGIQAIQPFQIFNDINAAKEKYGFVAVGGWDAFGPGNKETSSEEEIRDSVRTAMDKYSAGNRYVFWESGVTPVFKRNCQIIADEAYKYGRSIKF